MFEYKKNPSVRTYSISQVTYCVMLLKVITFQYMWMTNDICMISLRSDYCHLITRVYLSHFHQLSANV